MRDADAEQRRARVISGISEAVAERHRELAALAGEVLDSPGDPELAFDYLRKIPVPDETGLMLAGPAGPVAWAGQLRTRPAVTGVGTSVAFSPFYVALQVVATRGEKIAVATALLHAEPPADRIAMGVADRIEERRLASTVRFAPLADTSAETVISGATGHPLVRVEVAPISSDLVRFARTSSARGWGAVIFGVALIAFLAVAWSDRRAIAQRVVALAVALLAIGMIPWNNFSNVSKLFDPAYFYSEALGPLTANSGAFLMSASVILVGVVSVIRARIPRIPAVIAWVGTPLILFAGVATVEAAAGGIVLPRRGATPELWLAWETPLFLVLFASLLATLWLLRVALDRKRMVQLRAAGILAVLCGVVSTFVVWTRTTEQRLQLSMRDVAGLERADTEAAQLLMRFGEELSSYDSAGSRADLLERYATSDLAAAELQVSLGTWSSGGSQDGRLDLAQLEYDSSLLSSLVGEALASGAPIVRQTIGPTGRQVMLAVAHPGGGVTTAVASSRTRLVAENAYLPLLGFDPPDRTEPPYTLTLADVTPGGSARAGAMTWRRIGSEWHGDEIITTSRGAARAHVEVDLRSWPARLVRAALIVIFDVVLAGILWALATMTEAGFLRWVRSRSTRWLGSYRGRLTLALFTFFVVPAVSFAVWSYQRLQRDDRGARELLVREILKASFTGGPVPAAANGGAAPLFGFSGGLLASSSDPLYEMIAPAGRTLPRRVYVNLALHGELSSSARQTIAGSTMVWGYRAASIAGNESYVLAAPARSDEIVLDRRRRDITMLVLFANAVGGIAAFWLSGIAARILARDLELAKLEVARAERVIAWGEMARQVAHEIKNPLTPIRLGVQHLRRARSDPRVDFDRVLDDNVTRILSEIDRLDKIARTFTRYGSAPADLPPAEPVDAAAILRDVVALERMGIGGVDWILTGAEAPVIGMARIDELRDVLLNVFENSRLARAKRVRVELAKQDRAVTIVVDDDGAGVERAAVQRVFEPHFSTRTTGSGLGLAISRRLIESWGGSIDLSSEEGSGTRVTISLQAAA